MTFLLDTNTCIRYLNGRAPAVRKHLQRHSPSEIAVCSLVKAEMYFGAHNGSDIARTLDGQNKFLTQFSSLPFDDQCANVYGSIRAALTKRVG